MKAKYLKDEKFSFTIYPQNQITKTEARIHQDPTNSTLSKLAVRGSL